VNGILCADGLLTLVDLAATLDDDAWEQALESALRKGLVTIEDIDVVLPELARMRVHGVGRIRRVLAKRPKGAKATGSYLETLMVQIVRGVPEVPDLERQLRVDNEFGEFVAFVDLSCPPLEFFFELDGRGHEGQPEYDAVRETAVVAAMGWRCGRFTWNDLHRRRQQTMRRVAAIAGNGRRATGRGA
jgi:very-short-patch-repair endonuclease